MRTDLSFPFHEAFITTATSIKLCYLASSYFPQSVFAINSSEWQFSLVFQHVYVTGKTACSWQMLMSLQTAEYYNDKFDISLLTLQSWHCNIFSLYWLSKGPIQSSLY